MKPILYLDVDDTLLIWPGPVAGCGAREFLRWAKQHFEVRWLTMWCPRGDLGDRASVLATLLNMERAELAEIVNPVPFWVTYSSRDKTQSIQDGAIAERRPWVWVEDPYLSRYEQEWLREYPDYAANYYETAVSSDPEGILRTWKILSERFQLPAEIPTLADWVF